MIVRKHLYGDNGAMEVAHILRHELPTHCFHTFRDNFTRSRRDPYRQTYHRDSSRIEYLNACKRMFKHGSGENSNMALQSSKVNNVLIHGIKGASSSLIIYNKTTIRSKRAVCRPSYCHCAI